MCGVTTDRIKGLWVIATNTAHSWINQNEVRKILGKLDFLVVQDMYHTTETAQNAHLVLPAAAWGTQRSLNLPGITVSVGDMVEALGRRGVPQAAPETPPAP